MKLRAIISLLAILVVSSTVIGGYLFYMSERDASLREAHFLAESHIEDSRIYVESYIESCTTSVKFLANHLRIQEALINRTSQTIEKANIVLDNTHGVLNEGIFYLMDASGTVVASSNRHLPASFLGKNYQFRPYFQNAMAGQPSSYMAIGVTSKKAGIYQSYPVFSEGLEKPVGVIVCKFSVDKIETELRQEWHNEGAMAVLGPGGIVFASNRENWTMKSLWKLSETEQQNVAASKQFGSGPWDWTGFQRTDGNQVIDTQTGKGYMLHSRYLKSLPDWQIVFVHDYLSISQTLMNKFSRSFGSTIFFVCLIMGIFVLLLFKTADAEISKRKKAEDDLAETYRSLEDTVDRRTKELNQRNEQLALEIAEREKTAKELQQGNKVQNTLNKLLSFSLQDLSLEELLQLFIVEIASLPELNLSDKGAIFTIDEDPELLVLKGFHNLATPLHEICKTVPFGRCLCGRAAQEERVVFVNCIDHDHDNTFDGIPEHGHYCVPIYTPDRKICGVFTVYIAHDTEHSQRVEDFLVSTASILGVIIQHKRSEKERQESDEKYRAITNTANDAIIMMNQTGETIYWNPAATRIFGYTEKESMGKDLHDLIAPKEYHDLARNGMEGFVKTGHGNAIGETVELSGLRKDGTEFPVELSLSSVSIKGKRAAVGIVRDISERKDAEAERTTLQTQLRQAQKMEAIGTLAGGIAHDFNNILTSILGYTDLVKDAVEDDPEAMEDLGQVLKAADRARNLVRQILTFSRQAEQELLPVQISLIIKEAMKLLRAGIPTSIEIKQNILTKESTVLADPTQVHQILMNMCTNAFQAMRDGGGILEITLDEEQPSPEFIETYPDMKGGSFIHLQISDTGCGMGTDTLSRIFEPYFSTKKKEDGTGLGLSVVHGIIVGMGGGIDVKSMIGEGTTFSVYLPRVAEDSYAETEKTSQMPTGEEHILYVDDEQPIVNLAKRRLESLGYKVSTRTSSVEALEAFRNHPDRYDMIITDQTMPNMNGFDFATGVLKIRPDIPIILCTGYQEMDLGDDSSDLGISEVLLKPVSKEQFAEAIRKIFDKPEMAT